jgi:hypothetical protein
MLGLIARSGLGVCLCIRALRTKRTAPILRSSKEIRVGVHPFASYKLSGLAGGNCVAMLPVVASSGAQATLTEKIPHADMTAYQSSDYQDSNPGWEDCCKASAAVDGNLRANWDNRSLSHTAGGDSNPWWSVNLGNEYVVRKVYIKNRGGAGQPAVRCTGLAQHYNYCTLPISFAAGST